MDTATRVAGLPSHNICVALGPRYAAIRVHEDNQAMLRVVETGRNPTMRYLHRAHWVPVVWIHEIFMGNNVESL